MITGPGCHSPVREVWGCKGKRCRSAVTWKGVVNTYQERGGAGLHDRHLYQNSRVALIFKRRRGKSEKG